MKKSVLFFVLTVAVLLLNSCLETSFASLEHKTITLNVSQDADDEIILVNLAENEEITEVTIKESAKPSLWKAEQEAVGWSSSLDQEYLLEPGDCKMIYPYSNMGLVELKSGKLVGVLMVPSNYTAEDTIELKMDMEFIFYTYRKELSKMSYELGYITMAGLSEKLQYYYRIIEQDESYVGQDNKCLKLHIKDYRKGELLNQRDTMICLGEEDLDLPYVEI